MTEPVSLTMQSLIRERLRQIEVEEDIRVLFAIESGSRAWGFHSPDSDYDVRFIYTRPLEWHLSLQRKRDVVERPIDEELDISGWELSKALTLALGSNAVVAEWLQSPICYCEVSGARDELSNFAARVLDRKSVTWHYLSLLRRQQSRLLDPEGRVRLKRFFYILRPALALRWIRLNGQAMPPMDMTRLRQGADLSAAEVEALDTLTREKMQVREQAAGHDPAPILLDLYQREAGLAEDWLRSAEKSERSEYWTEANVLHRRFTLGPDHDAD